MPVAQAKASPTPAAEAKAVEAKHDAKPEKQASDSVPAAAKPESDSKGAAGTPLRPSAATSRTISPQAGQGNPPAAPSAAATVEKDVLASFKTFASKERAVQEKVRSSKARADKEVKLHELKKFGETFKLSTPVPKDLISIIAKDPVKQKAIQDKAMQDAEAVKKEKAAQEAAAAVKPKPSPASKETPAKVPTEPATSTGPAPAPTVDTRAASRPSAPQHSSSPSAVPGRHPGARQSYAPQQHYQQSYRGNRQNAQFGGQQPAQAQGLGQRIRANQAQYQHMNQHMPLDNMRPAPTGPASGPDQQFGRRGSGVQAAQFQQAKLNPNMPEFRPNAAPFAPSYAGPSQTSSPRSAINAIPEPPRVQVPPARGQLIRRKTKAVDVNKCNILRYLMTLKPPAGVNWDENLGLRPSFQTPVTWRAAREDGQEQSPTMLLTYKEWFDRQPFASGATATPNPQHVAAMMPLHAHQHQLPLHLQGAGHNLAPRPSPHMTPMQMQAGQPGPMAHAPPYASHADDHRMMQSNSAQSFSPRMHQQMPMPYGQNMNSPGPMYMQPVQHVQPVPYVNNAAPPMNPNYRSFSSNSQFMNQQPHMGPPMMAQGPYMQPNPMVQPGQMPMYPGAATHFMPPGAGPPPAAAASNGYPSPGRAPAPMMAQQGSQQGQPMMYGPSPGMNYQQLYQPQPPPNKYQGQRP